MPKRKLDDGAHANGVAEAASDASLSSSSSSAGAAAATSSTYSAFFPCDSGQSRTKSARLDLPVGTDADCVSASFSGSNKRQVRFDGVTVFYFERSQGFSCVPSFGGTTLGMTHRHHSTSKFSLAEHEQVLRDKQSQTRQKLAKTASNNKSSTTTITADESEESEEEEEEEDAGMGGADGDDGEEYFLQPLGGRDRRLLLKSAGVTVDKDERVDCQAIRVSRQTCGCSCQGNCLPETCECARDNVKCQVDRPSFPCGCTANGCANPEGRVEFNAVRVRTHYVQTMMRLRLEQQARFRGTIVPSPTHFRFDDDGSTYCSPPPPPIYNHHSTMQLSLSNGFNAAMMNGGVAMDTTTLEMPTNNGHITPTFPALHTFFYPNHHPQSSDNAAILSNGFAHHILSHQSHQSHQNAASMEQFSTQLSLNSSLSVDSGFDESSSNSNSSPTTPLPLAALYTHQRQRVEGPTVFCAPETTVMEAPAPATQTFEETTAAS